MIAVDDWQPSALSRTLGLVAGRWTDSGAVRRLDPAKVLAHAWVPRRLDRCRKLLAEGQEPPPINVVGFRIGQQTLYSVSDGMHRTIAAKEVGQNIKAKIGGYYRIDLSQYAIHHGWLWERDGSCLIRGTKQLSVEQITDFRRLGIPYIT